MVGQEINNSHVPLSRTLDLVAQSRFGESVFIEKVDLEAMISTGLTIPPLLLRLQP